MSTPTVTTESHPDLGAPAPSAPSSARRRGFWRGLFRADAMWWVTLLTAAFACFVTFVPKGGLNLESMTTTEMVLTLLGGLATAAAVLYTPAARSIVGGRKYGMWPVGLLIAFAALTALSAVWSVQPDVSFKDAGRMFAYCAVFGTAVALVRLAPGRWPAIIGGLVLAASIICGYALATKVFPGKLAPLVTYARLEEPYGYWNAIGLTAAMGAIAAMWLGARRAGHAVLSALAYPAMGLMLVTLMLAYSRGALAALAIGMVIWFCIVPLRLRGAAVLIVGAIAAGAIVAWDFSKHALTTDNIALGERSTAGHQLGALLVVMLLALMIAGVAIGFFGARRSRSVIARRRAGAILLIAVALALVAGAAGLAHSQRGFGGSISHAVDSLTNPNAKPPPNSPGRLTAVASVRARYWKEALQVFDAHPLLGSGAGGYETARLRYRKATLEVKHAHGFIVQTLADLGAVGLALVIALLLAWMAAAGRATHPFNRRWSSWGTWLRIRDGEIPGWRRFPQPYTPERIGMLSLLCIVVVFGAHSLIDWTWYVPGDACVALLCAGWLAGRGPLAAESADASATRDWAVPGPDPEAAYPRLHEGASVSERLRAPLGRFGPARIAVALAVLIAMLLAAWSQWQPQRSVSASEQALALVAHDPRAALAEAQTAVTRDPLSVQALITLATVQQARGESAAAKATLERGVSLQPSNPQTWLALARYELVHNPGAALKQIQAAIYLDPESISPEAIASGNPESIEIQNDYIRAYRAARAASTSAAAGSAGALTTAIAPRHRAGGVARRATRRRGALSLLGIHTSRERP